MSQGCRDGAAKAEGSALDNGMMLIGGNPTHPRASHAADAGLPAKILLGLTMCGLGSRVQELIQHIGLVFESFL
jgi:hypothetical protein